MDNGEQLELGAPVDGRAEVKVSADGLQAVLTVFRPLRGGVSVDFPQAMQALTYSGVNFGIEENAVMHALEPEMDGQPVVVAHGIPSGPGQDGQIILCFPNSEERLKPVELPDGRVDYRSLNLFHNVKKGDVLAVRRPPVSGEPGTTVIGKVLLPLPVRDAMLPMGKNTVSDEANENLLASVDGHVEYSEGRVSIQELLEIRRDVNFATGNVESPGSILVRGDICSGFAVKAGGNIEVGGRIEGASVTAGGDILVKSGISGAWKSNITAKGNIMALFIENATVEAGGNVIVNDSILNSSVRALGSVKAEGRHGTIAGGLVQAGEEISAKIIGAESGAATVLEVGVNPQLRKDYQAASKTLKERRAKLENMQGSVASHRKFLEVHSEMPPHRRAFLEEQIGEFEALLKEVALLEERFRALDEELARLSQGRIKARDTINLGVKITIVKTSYVVETPHRRIQFVLDNGEVKPVPFR